MGSLTTPQGSHIIWLKYFWRGLRSILKHILSKENCISSLRLGIIQHNLICLFISLNKKVYGRKVNSLSSQTLQLGHWFFPIRNRACVCFLKFLACIVLLTRSLAFWSKMKHSTMVGTCDRSKLFTSCQLRNRMRENGRKQPRQVSMRPFMKSIS